MRMRFALAGLLALAPDAWGIEFERPAVSSTAAFETIGNFAIVTINGPLMQHPSWCWDSYQAICGRIEEACKSDRPAVLLNISSPGGQVAGCFELVSWIRSRAAAAGKTVVAYVDGCAASAAYALACAADRIVVPSTGVVGSIGCIQVSVDETARDRAMGLAFEMIASGARKADGNPHVAMTDEARAAMQAGVDDMAATFFEVVASARKKQATEIAKLEAGVFVGAKAVAAGLADAVMTLPELIAAGAQQVNAGSAGAEANMNEEEKALKAKLKAIADGDDKEAAARAKKALAAYDDEGDEKKDEKEEKKEEAKAESEDDGKKDEKKDDADAKASAKTAPVLAIVEQKIASFEERQERRELMASRPDFTPEQVSVLEKSPLLALREAVKTWPKNTAKSQVRDARAALGVAPTIGAKPEDAEPNPLDVQMGLSRGGSPIRLEGNRHYIGVMTPAEASAEIARREAAAKKGAAE